MKSPTPNLTSALSRLVDDTHIAIRLGMNWTTYKLSTPILDDSVDVEPHSGCVRAVTVVGDCATEIELNGHLTTVLPVSSL